MRLRNRLTAAILLTACSALAERIEAPQSPAPIFHFQIVGEDAGAWPKILSSIGLTARPPRDGRGIYVITPNATADPAEWQKRVEQGAIMILEGDSPLARSFAIQPKEGKPAPVRSLTDTHNPKLQIVWERSLDLPEYALPATAKVFAKERWTGIPLLAGLRYGAGAVVWLAISPGQKGYERFPYLAQALGDLGLDPPVRSRRLWAFFDASYRARVDFDYFADRWREAGIGALHVAAWHFYDPNPEREQYLHSLIRACHRRGILVYAWLELPHVSEQFWRQHPEWREKTALGQDAHLDWRKLMNLQNPACARAVATGIRRLIETFDWDGVNLAELYFESLEGHANAARFTPLNDDARLAFATAHGFDPAMLFDPYSPRHYARDAASLRAFLDWRAGLARRMQEEWIARIEDIRKTRTHLDLVLTHVDDRYDTRMRDLIGADAARLLPLMDRHDFTFLVEDPATIWHLGPERYTEIAARYLPLVSRPRKLAIDINIVERYQDVYPTKQQTGVELFQLTNLASRAFPRVALYFENSILKPDLAWLSSSAATPDRLEWVGDKLAVESSQAIGIPWRGPATVNGQLWPAADGRIIWLPAGAHAIEPAGTLPSLRLLDFSGDLLSAAALPAGIELSYRGDARCLAFLDHRPSRVEIDGVDTNSTAEQAPQGWLLRLPRGQHVVAIFR